MTRFFDANGRPAGTTTVSDALDRLGVDGGCRALKPIQPGTVCAGPAVTILFGPAAPGTSAPAADYIDDIPAGAVIVMDNGGRSDCTVWGDILSACAVARGVAGTVIHGCCRDSAGIRELGYPVFALATYMKSGKGRTRMIARDVPVTIGGTSVHPGDLIVGDDDGVIAIPQALVGDVARMAAEIAAIEERVLAAVAAGTSLAEARAANGYHAFAWRGAR